MLQAEQQAAGDAELEALVTALRPRQAGVRSSAGRYRSCVRGASWGSWEAQKPDPAAVQNARADEYLAPNPDPEGPDLPGWTVSGELTDGGGVVWRRVIHVTGPETYREAAWAVVEAEGR